jgi:vacuolar-type H+-ATPase subunit I/STV1
MPHKSTNSKSFGEVVTHWDQLGSGLKANTADVPHLEGHGAQLQDIVTQAKDLLSEQKIQTASKQDLSRQIEALLDQGTKIASFLRAGVKQHYGTRSEKLVEFDLLPFRGKAKPATPVAPVVKPPAPETPKPKIGAPAPPVDPSR